MKKLFIVTTTVLMLTVAHNLANAQCTKLLDFIGTNGLNPGEALISDGIFLYGMTSDGGSSYSGTLFKIKPDGSSYSILINFNGNTNGISPFGSLIYDGTFLYGMTYLGGTNAYGTIFKIKPNGTGYSTLFDFIGTKGSYPYGSLVSDGVFIYGLTTQGGTSDMGTLFRIKADGTGYANILNFTDTLNGSYPNASLLFDGTYLYGTTSRGGTNNMGSVFKIKTDGSGYSMLLDLAGISNGSYPLGNLISDGIFLYGMTSQGGANNLGTIFKVKTDGSGYIDLLDFDGASNGKNPYGSLMSDGTFLYGMASQGGLYDYGTLFEIKSDGSTYSKLMDFTDFSNGRYPNGTLISDSTFLYGMTWQGGANDMGVIFKYGLFSNIEEQNIANALTISPNPFSIQTVLQSNNSFHNATLTVYNCFGQRVKQIKNISGQTVVLSRDNLASGLYFLRLTEENNPDSYRDYTDKLVITDK